MSLVAQALAFGPDGRRIGDITATLLDRGEIACVLGPNGSGKTTLLRTLLGLLAPISGDVLLDGRSLARLAPPERARLLAYVPQVAEGHAEFSVAEIVRMGRTPHAGLFARPSIRDVEAASRAMDRLGIRHLAHRPMAQISGGERQLALIARAVAGEASWLLMDEPTANLDIPNQARVLREMTRLRDAGTAILFTTHYPDQALRIADRAILLQRGTVLAAGDTDATVNSMNLSALYGCAVEVADVTLPTGRTARVCV